MSINVRAGKIDGPRKKSNGPKGLEARLVMVMERVLSTEPKFQSWCIQNPKSTVQKFWILFSLEKKIAWRQENGDSDFATD